MSDKTLELDHLDVALYRQHSSGGEAMPTERYKNQIEVLQRGLEEARRQGNINIEVFDLFDLGELAEEEGDFEFADSQFERAARVIVESKTNLINLDKALARRARIHQWMKRYPESLALYEQAAAAAKEHVGQLEYAHWVSKQGDIYHLMENRDKAREAYQNALNIFKELGKEGLVDWANQEGNLGLLASEEKNDEYAERAYRRALEIATTTNSQDTINRWANALGNVLSRKRSYHEAWGYFKQALEASLQSGSGDGIINTAKRWSLSFGNAHQNEQAADLLIRIGRQLKHLETKYEFFEEAMYYLRRACLWEKLQKTASELDVLLQEQKVDPLRIERCHSMLDLAITKIQKKPMIVRRPSIELPTILDMYIVANKKELEEKSDIKGMRDVAHLICDAALGLQNSSEEAWKSILSNPVLRYQVLEDALKSLALKGLIEQSLELSQRIKGIAFSLPNIEKMRKTGPPHAEAAAYLESIENLSRAVAALKDKMSIAKDGVGLVEEMRAAGESVLECGDYLRSHDRTLHAKLGGVIHPQELIEALSDRVAIVDLFVTKGGTVVHILARREDQVKLVGGFAASFSTEQAIEIMKKFVYGNVTYELSERQYKALIEIGKILHDCLCCSLAHSLIKIGATQIIFVLDRLTRYLPFHLAHVCSEDINIPGVDTAGARFLNEVFPIEYAPCIQAIAVSQQQKRRPISSVISFNDPMEDLPAARHTAKWLSSTLPENVNYSSYEGKQATLANLSSRINGADIVLIGTHGVFKWEKYDDSELVFYDKSWIMKDILTAPPFNNNPAFILSACQIGAIGPAPELANSFPHGIPGALLSSGASFILASLWPAEDISMGFIVERFYTHLSNPGYRPAAALFYALRDLKRITKEEAVGRLSTIIDEMNHDGSRERSPELYLKLYNFRVWIEDSDKTHPFAEMLQAWGGVVIVGCGWYLPAGAWVNIPWHIIENTNSFRKAASIFINQNGFEEAREFLKLCLKCDQGADRARTLDKMAWVIWASRKKEYEESAKKEAMELLSEAEFVAKADQDEQLLRNINATRQKIYLEGGN